MSSASLSPACYPVRRLVGSSLDWQTAVCLRDFTFPWENTPAPQTEFRALWDDEKLYFRFVCVDEDLVLGSGETLKERVLGSDRVELFFAPDLNLTPYYAFEMSPRAEALVYAGQFYRQFDWEWACPELTLEAEINGATYHVQGSLPLATLRRLGILKPDSMAIHVGVYRAEFSHQADGSIHSGWMPWVNPQTERPDFHVPASFGVFELV